MTTGSSMDTHLIILESPLWMQSTSDFVVGVQVAGAIIYSVSIFVIAADNATHCYLYKRVMFDDATGSDCFLVYSLNIVFFI